MMEKNFIDSLLPVNKLLLSGVSLVGSLVTVFFAIGDDINKIYEDNQGLVVSMGMDMIGNHSMTVLGSDGRKSVYAAYPASNWYIQVVSKA
jgi:hypothetical protein